jgi:hypothetical protein
MFAVDWPADVDKIAARTATCLVIVPVRGTVAALAAPDEPEGPSP